MHKRVYNLESMNWNFEPSIVIGIALASVAYGLSVDYWRDRFTGSEPVARRQVICFALAMLTLAVALLSPLDELADQVSLSAHMIQHLLLTLVMPPFLLLGLPAWMLRPALRLPFALLILRWLTRPITAYIAFNAVFAAWHVPALYELTLQNETWHILEHLLFMGTALLTWWPIVGPLPELPRPPYPAQVLYLFFQSVIPTVLGSIITFADEVLYPTYARAGQLGGFSALEDQQMGGLIMWIPGALVYLAALTAVFFVWFEGKEKIGEIR